jgi:predicted dehydrogenase
MHKIGVIGAGMIAEHHIGAIQRVPDLEVLWIAATKQSSLDRILKKFPGPNTTIDYTEILKDKEVDAVIICTPPHLHKKIFEESLEAGKHILLEKPAAMTLDEIDHMIDYARKYPHLKVLDCSARHSRLIPKFRKVKELIDSGELGQIYHIHHNAVNRYSRPGIEYHPTAKWFLNKAIAGGGPLFDWGVYDLSFHLGILSDEPGLKEIKHVSFKSGLDDFDQGDVVFDVEEMFVAMLEFTGGITFYWERASHANMSAPNETRIYGTKGGIKLAFCSWDDPDIIFYGPDKKEERIEMDYSGQDDALALIQHFSDVLEEICEPIMPLELARKHLEIIFRCYSAG